MNQFWENLRPDGSTDKLQSVRADERTVTAAITLSLCASELPPTSDKDAGFLNSFAFCIDLNKILLPVVVRAKAEKPDIYFYIPVHK